jgi:hypothetical protein
VNYRRCEVAYNSYRGRRGNAYENRYPNRSFNHRNENFANRYELDNSRSNQTVYSNTRNFSNNSISTRGNSNQRTEIQNVGTPRNYYANNNTIRVNSNSRSVIQQNQNPTENIRNYNQRENNYSNASLRNSGSGEYSNQRMNTERVERAAGNPRGNKRS